MVFEVAIFVRGSIRVPKPVTAGLRVVFVMASMVVLVPRAVHIPGPVAALEVIVMASAVMILVRTGSLFVQAARSLLVMVIGAMIAMTRAGPPIMVIVVMVIMFASAPATPSGPELSTALVLPIAIEPMARPPGTMAITAPVV